MHGAVKHRLAVFVLADLQVRRVGGAFDEIAGGVDHEQPHPRTLDLAAEQKRHVEIDVLGLQRIARPMRCAAWNMVGEFSKVSTSPVCGSSSPSVSVDSTDWLIARLPALATAMMRSPGLLKIWSLRKVETLSRPALVRVSAIMTRPSRTSTPQQ